MSYVIFFTLALSVVFVAFFIAFQKRKNQLILDKIEQQKAFDEELIKTQQEIQEETLGHIGRELHDNIGQMLVMSSMQMNAAAKVVGGEAKIKVDNAAETLKITLEEVRALSKSLNSDVIFNLGFDVSLTNEINRINKSGLIDSNIAISGVKVNFENKKDELILFRIFQEFSANTLKYSEAKNLTLSLNYLKDQLEITMKNNGIGFDVNNIRKGSGILNMKKRAKLINADFQLESKSGVGTTLKLIYPYRTI
ncbi:sensor histidine kinase [Winogradskyella pelagia]|nr:histidine kinase [Winogradskyella sp. DF17]